ncbi:MAG: adenylate/guanylate cyclase domain-containing protein [Methylococcaceae bacterium]|nr:adenylate/guanylate cyclase domain-containing protein [Methylococcaceae bacterium]
MRRTAALVSGLRLISLCLAIGIGTALLGLTPYFSLLEEKAGLALLFWMRGEKTPPVEIVIVNIDRDSSAALGQPDTPNRWNRHLHAEAVRRLQAAGVELIAFNIFFGLGHPDEDEDLAGAMRTAGNVVLADFLTLKHLQDQVYIESLEKPTPVLARSALAEAPFLLARGAESTRFLTWHGDANEYPTLPVTLLQLYLWKAAVLVSPLSQDEAKETGISSTPADRLPGDSALAELVRRYRASGTTPPLPQLSERQRQALTSLVKTYADRSPRYFDHYGDTALIPRIPYQRLIQNSPEELPDLHGKIVLIGFSENFQPEGGDSSFYSPFSPISNLELAALALSNLIENKSIHPLLGTGGQFVWLLVWGCFIGLLSQARTLIAGTAAIFVSAAAYLAAASFLFAVKGLWLPLILPLLLQVPAGLITCLVNNYLTRSREHRKIHSVIRRFIPVDVASQLIHPADPGHWEGHLAFGACLATDAGQYTSLAEKMEPMSLGELMNCYYAAIFPPVATHHGWVSDVVGDAMMAIWTASTDEPELRIRALNAALEIRSALAAFEAERNISLPIRMGLHCGEMRVGFVGSTHHGEYRAVGDTVNTAARLEALNKVLGTQVLVSTPTVSDLTGFVSRPLGSFLLAGKTQPVTVHELIGLTGESKNLPTDLLDRFESALALFQAERWESAAECFAEIARDFPEDGPTLFYLDAARARAANPDLSSSDRAIRIEKPPSARPSIQ